MDSDIKVVQPNPTVDYILTIYGMVKILADGDTAFHLEIPEFKLRRGSFCGLVGRSGSGKSTMLDLLAMVSKPSAVESHNLSIRVDQDNNKLVDVASRMGTDGMVPRSKKTTMSRSDDKFISMLRQEHFGYVLQSGGLFPFLSVRENLELPFRMSGRPFDRARMEAQIARFDLTDQLDKKPSGLSGGQRQRVGILRALATNPALLLADEPTAAVDENMAEIIMREMRNMAIEQGTTVIVVSHDIQLIESHADQLVRLRPKGYGVNQTCSICQLK